MTRLIVGPFNRVEGDLEVKLEIEDGRVHAARVVSTLYRGFERMLVGKVPDDALVYAPRICGICSVSQSVAAAKALAAAAGIEPVQNGSLAANLVHATENVADHLTHFYLFFMPDFARTAYATHTWHDDVVDRFKAVTGSATRAMSSQRSRSRSTQTMRAPFWTSAWAISVKMVPPRPVASVAEARILRRSSRGSKIRSSSSR